MEEIIGFLDNFNYVQGTAHILLAYFAIAAFIPLRKHWIPRLLALLPFWHIVPLPIYLEDPWNISLGLLGFGLCIFAFYSGKWEKKLAAVLIFYPMIVAVNFLQFNVSGDLFFALSHAPSPARDQSGRLINWSQDILLMNSVFYFLSNTAKVLFWVGVLLFMRRKKRQIASVEIERRTWLIADVMMLVSTIAIFTAILFVNQANYVVYPLFAVIIPGALVGVSLVVYMSRSEQTAQEAQRLSRQFAYYEEKLKAEEKVRSLYHDMKNHLLLLERQDSQDAREMAADLRRQISDYEDYVRTGNEFLDIILRDKARQAKENQVDFSAVVHFEQGGFMELMDISTIFGNALDNALEASLKLPPEQRLVTVKAECVRDMLSIVLENNCMPDGADTDRTSKGDDFLHGFGVRNIKKAVEKYAGQCLIRQEKGCFQMKLLLPLPQ
ncbi:MAG: GHKL domain-containing protein [Lachnospiraceae bacterium]|nr:GHKL domain-containing protein [Lachnospiraceae bacterium]